MAKKIFKIGEYAVGGVIEVNIEKKDITIINRDWDFTKGSKKSSDQSQSPELSRININSESPDAYDKLYDYLSELTTHYYSEEIIKYIASNIKIGRSFF
jgi:hypothetical protein